MAKKKKVRREGTNLFINVGTNDIADGVRITGTRTLPAILIPPYTEVVRTAREGVQHEHAATMGTIGGRYSWFTQSIPIKFPPELLKPLVIKGKNPETYFVNLIAAWNLILMPEVQKNLILEYRRMLAKLLRNHPRIIEDYCTDWYYTKLREYADDPLIYKFREIKIMPMRYEFDGKYYNLWETGYDYTYYVDTL